MGLKITKDTLSPRLKEIEKGITPTSILAVKEAHDVYSKIQKPLVPVGDSNKESPFFDEHAGLLLASMGDTENILNFAEEIYGIRFGFYAHDESGSYALIQEEQYPYKHVRYPKHNPTIHYFREGLQYSKKGIKATIDKRFGELLK